MGDQLGSTHLRFSAEFEPEVLDRLRERLAACLDLWGLSSSQVHSMVAAADEVVGNILEHGGGKWVELEMSNHAERVHLVFRDNGLPFDSAKAILENHSPDALGSDERRLGLYMLGRMGENFSYRLDDKGSNELAMDIPVRA